jgi:hypothetical protein
VGIFRRRDDEPVDMNERSPRLGVRFKDLAVLGQLIENGADLSESRHVAYYSYAPREDVARAMQQEAETKGFLQPSASRYRSSPASGPSFARPTRSHHRTSSVVQTTSSRGLLIVMVLSTTGEKRVFDSSFAWAQ